MQITERDARMHHRFKTKSGSLERSIQHDTSKDGLYGRVFLNTGTAKYGPYQHDGTKPHRIYATNKAALYFVKNGIGYLVPRNMWDPESRHYWRGVREKNKNVHLVEKGFVNHPGIKADKFLDKALMRQKPYIIARIRGALARAFQIAGLK
jgi:hypothetical protein